MYKKNVKKNKTQNKQTGELDLCFRIDRNHFLDNYA